MSPSQLEASSRIAGVLLRLELAQYNLNLAVESLSPVVGLAEQQHELHELYQRVRIARSRLLAATQTRSFDLDEFSKARLKRQLEGQA
jgi:hypothetical protein